MRLTDLEMGQRARVQGFSQGYRFQGKMQQYGIFQGDEVRVVRKAPLRGPILVAVSGREIALGRGIAEKILVTPEEG